MKNIISTFLVFILTYNIQAAVKIVESEADIFNANSELYYEIGGAKRINPPVVGDNANINIGLGGDANIDYSCGEFDYGASFKNLMDSFKNGADSVKNVLVNGVQAGISALPLAALQRALPGIYDMFQEYSAEANTEIEVATKSCEQIEADLVAGESLYASFLQTSKAQDWKDKAQVGDDIVSAKKEIEKSVGKNGIISFGGKKVGGEQQPALKIIASSTGAGLNFMLSNANLTKDAKISKNAELYKYFKTIQEAREWATNVLGEFEINNKKPITKIGTGLHKQVEFERIKAKQQLDEKEYNKLGLNHKLRTKLNDNFDNEVKAVLLANILDDIAIKRVIEKALVVRRALIISEQDPHIAAADNKISKEQRSKAITNLNNEIESLMFAREIKQKLTNDTILAILKAPIQKTTNATKPENNLLLDN